MSKATRTRDTLTTPAGRVVFIRAAKRLSEAESAAALSSIEESHPAWVAINQILDEELATAVLDASAPNLNPALGTYPGGKIAALGELKDRLHRLRAKVWGK